ncbi:hypothetical protein IFM89_006046 [Coptis chinensis]|uniref:Uncharacterized protein n=1 Tax=Coptis chinensis TaxID=261450 RepID=A0A835I079_9MAGN|nr:hypothetical protein IFM89_006046 [Coptis chinensis]
MRKPGTDKLAELGFTGRLHTNHHQTRRKYVFGGQCTVITDFAIVSQRLTQVVNAIAFWFWHNCATHHLTKFSVYRLAAAQRTELDLSLIPGLVECVAIVDPVSLALSAKILLQTKSLDARAVN